MKTIAFVLFCIAGLAGLNAQVPDLTGTWTMFEMAYLSGGNSQKMTEDQMKANGSVTDYYFMDEGKFKMISNMSGSGTMDTIEGTWILENGELKLTLKLGERLIDVIWKAEFKENAMHLTRVSPDGSVTISNSFRKK